MPTPAHDHTGSVGEHNAPPQMTQGTFPRYEARQARCLDGFWRFAFLGDVAFESVQPRDVTCAEVMAVPGVFDASPVYAGQRGVAVYQTAVDIEPGSAAELRFDGLGLRTRLFIDGQYIAQHNMPYSGWSVVVEPAGRATRELTLIIDNRIEQTTLVEPYFDFYLYGGIYRSVWLRHLPGPAIRRAQVTTLDWRSGRVRVDAEAFDALPDEVSFTASFDGHARFVPEQVERSGTGLSFEAVVPEAHAWSPKSPKLHTMTLRVGRDVFMVRFGVREIRVAGHEVLLNDEPLTLRGVCRHESHPQFGPALPAAQLVQDLQLLRQTGCNVVRGSHYPQDPRFLDLCDEMGVLVFEESLGWQPRTEHYQNPEFVDLVVAQSREMVRASYNHPCVIMWGFLNEGHSEQPVARPVYERIVAAMREQDATRPITYACNHPQDDTCLDLADIVCINMYPGWYTDPKHGPRPLDTIAPHMDSVLDAMNTHGVADRPFIISEIGAGAIYGWNDPHATFWTEAYQADLLDVVCAKCDHDPRINGLIIWQFCDSRTYSDGHALGRPRAFNNKGLFVEYRRPKRAAATVAQAYAAAKPAGNRDR